MSRLIDGLRDAGHEIHVFAAQWDQKVRSDVIFHRVPVLKSISWLKTLSFSRNCHKLISVEQPDIVFSLERTLHQDIYRAGDGCHQQWLIQKNLGKGRLSKLITALNPLQQFYVQFERRLFTDPHLGAIIANSERGRQDIVRLYGVDPTRIHVVYNGIDSVVQHERTRNSKRKELAAEFALGDELRILYVGSGFRRKGVPAAIAAAAKLAIPFRLFIVGKGNPSAYRRMAQRFGIADRVIFTGPRKDVELFYQGSDLFIFPTLYDPFSNATLEAMGHGLPVITSCFNGVSELINSKTNGFVIQDPLNVSEIAECLNSLTDETLRHKMGELAAETASAFTMTRNVSETLRVIEKVISMRHQGFN